MIDIYTEANSAIEKIQRFEVEHSDTQDPAGSKNDACLFDKTLALGNGSCCLTLINIENSSSADLNSSQDPVIAEIEFDHQVDALCWEPDGRCLVASDRSGTIHFITRDGVLVYSRRVFQGY